MTLTKASEYLRDPPTLPFGEKFSQLVRTRGIVWTALICLESLLCRLIGSRGIALKERIWRLESERYDRARHVRTAGWVAVRDMSVQGPQTAAASDYVCLRPIRLCHEMLKQLDVDHSRTTFVDFGSGMGRALFLAAEYPFRRIVGVEFGPELHQIAAENIRTFTNPRQKCFNLESHCMSAEEFEIPKGDLVLLFFNPFGPAVMEPVLANLGRALAENSRKGFVIYTKPKCGYLMDAAPFLEKVTESLLTGYWYSIYRMKSC